MARIQISIPQPGDALDESVINDNFTAVSTQSGSLDGENFAEEGLDEQGLLPSDLMDAGPYFAEYIANTTFYSGVPAEMFSANLRTPAFTVPANGIARIRANIELPNNPAGPIYGVPGLEYVQFWIAYKQPAGSAVVAADSERLMESKNSVGRYGNVMLETILLAGDYDYVTIYAQGGSGGTPMQVGNLSIGAVVFHEAF